MPDRHLITIHLVAAGKSGFLGPQMGRNLVTEEVEIDPFLCPAAAPASQQLDVELLRLGQIGDWKGEVEGRHGHGKGPFRVRFPW